MHQLVYFSQASHSLEPEDLDRILGAAVDFNRTTDVTGLLLFDGKRFIQALEGPKTGVTMVMDRIKADRRHRDIVYMPLLTDPERQFGSWSMHGEWLNDADEAEGFYRSIPSLLRDVSNRDVFAAFLGFASMSRASFKRAGPRFRHAIGLPPSKTVIG